MIDHCTGHLISALEHYKHAENHINNKKKTNKAQVFMLTDDEGETVYFQAEHGRVRGRKKRS